MGHFYRIMFMVIFFFLSLLYVFLNSSTITLVEIFQGSNIVCSKLSSNKCYYEPKRKNVWYWLNFIHPITVSKLRRVYCHFLIMEQCCLLMVIEWVRNTGYWLEDPFDIPHKLGGWHNRKITSCLKWTERRRPRKNGGDMKIPRKLHGWHSKSRRVTTRIALAQIISTRGDFDPGKWTRRAESFYTKNCTVAPVCVQTQTFSTLTH